MSDFSLIEFVVYFPSSIIAFCINNFFLWLTINRSSGGCGLYLSMISCYSRVIWETSKETLRYLLTRSSVLFKMSRVAERFDQVVSYGNKLSKVHFRQLFKQNPFVDAALFSNLKLQSKWEHAFLKRWKGYSTKNMIIKEDFLVEWIRKSHNCCMHESVLWSIFFNQLISLTVDAA